MAEEQITYKKLVHLCARSGSEGDWNSANPVLLQGEIGISHDARFNYVNQRDDISILKIGNGRSTWNELGYDTVNAKDTNSIFFAGRGAGILPAVFENANGDAHLGAFKLLPNERSLHIDDNGYLSFRTKLTDGTLSSTTSITVDEIYVGTLHVNEAVEVPIRAGDYLVLREGDKTAVGSDYSGFVIANISGFDENGNGYDKGIIIDGNGNWNFGIRSRNLYNDTETGEEKQNVGAWDAEQMQTIVTTIPTVITEDPQPVLMENSQLIPWTPSTLSITINNDEKRSYTYSPYQTTEAGAVSLNIPTLEKITVKTVESDTETEIAEEEYEIDETGNIELILPIPTQASVDAWNNKITKIVLNGYEITNINNNVSFIDSEVTIEEGQISLPYIKKIIYGTDTYLSNGGEVEIEPKHTSVVHGEDNEDIIVDSGTNTLGGTEYKINHKTYNDPEGSTVRVDNILNAENIEMIQDIQVENGHIVEITKASYGLEDLINKINELEARLAALES